MVKEVSFSLDDLDAVKHSETPFEFELMKANGDGSGIFLSVLGGNSDVVRTTAADLINARRQKQAVREMAKAKSGRNTQTAEFDTVESDIEFGQRLAAVRLVGWRNIKDTWSKENADKLCRSNPGVAAQVMEQSDNLANFTKV
jgi:hypothetical protein